jgi:hypothetical protein
MKTVSIGYHRDDGDFAILATLNNNDGHLTVEDFEQICKSLLKAITIADNHHHVVILERQDTPDYVTIEGETA